MTKYWPLIAAIAILGLDRVLKNLALGLHALGGPNFGFQLFRNSGLVFSLPTPLPVAVFLMLLGLVAVVFMMIRWRQPNGFPVWAAALMAAGAFSNIFDRLRFGFIVDYLWLGSWMPIFNLADLALAAGLVVLIFNRPGQPKIDKQPLVK
jgi:signal peptidase II